MTNIDLIYRNNVWHRHEKNETNDDEDSLLVGGKKYLNVVHGDDRISFDSSRRGMYQKREIDSNTILRFIINSFHYKTKFMFFLLSYNTLLANIKGSDASGKGNIGLEYKDNETGKYDEVEFVTLECFQSFIR